MVTARRKYWKLPLIHGGHFMNHAVLGLILAVAQLLPEGFAQESKPILQLSLSPDKSEVVSGTKFDLTLRVVNLTQQIVDCTRVLDQNNLDVTYTYDIRASDGKPVSYIYEKEAPKFVSARPCQLQPKDSFEITLVGLMSAYEMKPPGVYSIQVLRPDRSHPGRQLGASNKVTVIVKAPG